VASAARGERRQAKSGDRRAGRNREEIQNERGNTALGRRRINASAGDIDLVPYGAQASAKINSLDVP